jgi:hypothetical protein
MTQPQYLRRDEHPTMPVIYRWKDGRKYRCSEREFSKLLADMAMERIQQRGVQR